MVAAILLALGVCLPVGRVQAAEASGQNDLCLGCHSDKSMTTKHAGRTVSLFVDGKKFSASVHGSLSCTNCHADLEGADFPHPTPKKVQCGTCHADEAGACMPSRCTAKPLRAAMRWLRAASIATAITTSCR